MIKKDFRSKIWISIYIILYSIILYYLKFLAKYGNIIYLKIKFKAW